MRHVMVLFLWRNNPTPKLRYMPAGYILGGHTARRQKPCYFLARNISLLNTPFQVRSRFPHGMLFQLVEMLQSGQDGLLARLLDLAGEKDLVEDGVDLVEVEDEIELGDVAEEGIEDLDEEVDGLEVCELVVVCVDADAEEEAGVAAVDDLVLAELDKVGLVLLVAGRDEAVDLALDLDLFLVAEGGVPLGETGLASVAGGGGLVCVSG